MKPNDLPLMSKTVQNLLKMKQALIEKPDDEFDMEHWVDYNQHTCKTTHCLLGSYIAKYGAETGLKFTAGLGITSINYRESELDFDDMVIISREIGITRLEACKLFLPNTYFTDKDGLNPLLTHCITKNEVMKRLDNLIKKYERKQRNSYDLRG